MDENTGGATGEQPVPAGAEGSPSLTDEIMKDLSAAPAQPPAEPAKPKYSDDFLKQLETADPGELPQSFRERLEKPFLSQYGKKTTEWDNERRSYVDAIEKLTRRLETTNAAVPQDTQTRIKEMFENGDYEGATALIREEVRNEITPERQYVSTAIAINEAKTLMPDLAKYEGVVAQVIKADPVIAELANISNRKYAGRVIAALAFQAENVALKQQLGEVEKTIEGRVRQAIEETQRRIKGLPPSTSRAGSTQSAVPASKPLNLREAMEAAFAEQGGV